METFYVNMFAFIQGFPTCDFGTSQRSLEKYLYIMTVLVITTLTELYLSYFSSVYPNPVGGSFNLAPTPNSDTWCQIIYLESYQKLGKW